MESLRSVKERIANVDVHTALQTPHPWVLIKNCALINPKGFEIFRDVRICPLCYYAEKYHGNYDKRWSPLLGVDTENLLYRYTQFKRRLV